MSIATGDDPIHLPITLFLCQLMLIVGMCKIMSFLFKKIKQPSVIAEVVTGIVLGPSVLGYIPHYLERMFPEESMTIISVVANVGLILFMFLVGLELDADLLRHNYQHSIIISITAIALPFGLGSASSLLVYHTMIDTDKVGFGNFILFIGVALSITAFPVLARILTEYGMLQTKVGTTAMSAAAVDDVLAWIILALVVAIARSTSQLDCLYTFLMLVGYVAFMFGAVKPALQLLVRRTCRNNQVAPVVIIVLLLLIFLSAWFTEIIGVHAIFGGFVTGVICPRQGKVTITLTERFEDIVVVLLLPLYFAFSGLRTRLGTMNTGIAWGCLFLITAAACIGKIAGAVAASKFLKHSWRESFTIGILMNTKGLVELIVLNIGLDVGVLNDRTFTVFVVMALITTFMTTPLLHLVWLSKQRKNPKDKKEGKLYLNTYAPDAETGASLITVSKLLITGAQSHKIKAIHFNEVSERPSSYFFIVNNINSNLKLTVPQPLQLAVERGKMLGIPVKARMLSVPDIESGLVHHADSTGSDIILLKWDLEQSPSSPGRMIQHALGSAENFSVAVLADKGFGKITSIKKVFVVFTGMEYESGIIFLLKQLANDRASGIRVQVFTGANGVPFIRDLVSPTFVISEHAQPLIAAAEASSHPEDQPDLVVVGVENDWYKTSNNAIGELVERAAVSVLLLHGTTDIATQKSGHARGSSTDEVELPVV